MQNFEKLSLSSDKLSFSVEKLSLSAKTMFIAFNGHLACHIVRPCETYMWCQSYRLVWCTPWTIRPTASESHRRLEIDRLSSPGGEVQTLFMTVRITEVVYTRGGGGGMSHWGLYIIRVNHFLKSTLNEDEATVPTALWTLHRTGVSLPDFLPFPRIVRGPVREICEFDTHF